MKNIVLNGKPHAHRGDGSLLSLLEEIGADSGRVAVVLNDDVVERSRLPKTDIEDGDRIEILIFAGGG